MLGRALVLLSLALPVAARADLPFGTGEPLEGTSTGATGVTRACSARYCLWHVSQYLGGCSGEDCNAHFLAAGDVRGRALGGYQGDFPRRASVRFLDDTRFEEVIPRELVEHNPACKGWDLGVAPIALVRRAGEIIEDGREIRIGAEEPLFPRSAELIARRMEALRAEPPPGAKVLAVTPAQLDQARRLCTEPLQKDSDEVEPFEEVARACSASECLVVLGAKDPDEPERLLSGCSVVVTRKGVRVSPMDAALGWSEVSVRGNLISFMDGRGGIRGGPCDELFLLRNDPTRMAFISPAGLELPSADPYPALPGASLPASAAPTAVASTSWHLQWTKGTKSWGGPGDLSLSWQAVRAGDALLVRVEVKDDRVVTAALEGPLWNDHLELTLSRQVDDKGLSVERLVKLGALPAKDGQVGFRLWKRGKREVDEPFAGTGSWQKTAAGYVMQVRVPLAALAKELGPGHAFKLKLSASDADGVDGQEVLMGHTGRLRLWSTYPPTLVEYGGNR